VSIVAILATIGVYGIVALIVRMDDLGLTLNKRSGNEKSISSRIGYMLVRALPLVIRVLAVIGTLAMLLVAGGIFVHNIPLFHDMVHSLPKILGDFIAGLVVGLIVVFIVKLFSYIAGKNKN
jgi:predicted DNA repair protein MutK